MLWAGTVSAQSICVPGDGDWLRQVCLEREAGTPTYGHQILGDTPEWNLLTSFYGPTGAAETDDGAAAQSITPQDAAYGIFEDIAPRLFDVTGDGRLEAIVVETSPQQGARISVYAFDPDPRLLAATEYVGQRNRWYAPIGAADLDGDGHVEIAFVDRPHLARILRVVRFRDGVLEQVTQGSGVTNHKIGEDDIAGGIRECGNGPEIIVATTDWSRLLSVVLVNNSLAASDIGPHRSRADFDAAMACR